MLTLLKTIFYIPLYNAFVVLLHIPHIDAGIAVILFTVVIKTLLFPLSKKSLIAQVKIKEIEPDIQKIKEKYKDDAAMQSQKTLELYREKKINPFLGILLLFIQIPIVISIYRIFSSGAASEVNATLLYSFISVPAAVSPLFLGLFNVTAKNVYLSVIVGLTQFLQARLQPIPTPKPKQDGKSSFQHDFTRSMNLNMKYFFPIMVFLISLGLPSVLGLYWITSNVFTIVQEIFLREHRNKLTKAV